MAWDFPPNCAFPAKGQPTQWAKVKALRATDTILIIPLNETIKPLCFPVSLIPLSTAVLSWTVMALLRWAHLFPHVDDVAPIAMLGVWERPALPAWTNNWHNVTQISSLEVPSCHHVARWMIQRHGVLKRGVYSKMIRMAHIQACGHEVNWWHEGSYVALYKRVMNINETAVSQGTVALALIGIGAYGMPRQFWWMASPSYMQKPSHWPKTMIYFPA